MAEQAAASDGQGGTGGARGAGAPRRGRPRMRLEVLRNERITPHMVRVTLGGEGLAGFHDNDWADHYVKLAFPTADGEVVRTYTVRRYDAAAGELVIDFVYHGDEGVAGPWAAGAAPGDTLELSGPGGAYSPGGDADFHLLAGDESALPAIGSALERLAPGARALVLLEVSDEAERQELTSRGEVEVRWLLRDAAPAGTRRGDLLVAAVHGAEFPEGAAVQAFVHGEAESVMKRLRPHLLKERGLTRDQLSISGYWRQGDTEADFRAWKAAEREREAAGTAGRS